MPEEEAAREQSRSAFASMRNYGRKSKTFCVSQLRRNEESIPLEQVEANLIRSGKLNA